MYWCKIDRNFFMRFKNKKRFYNNWISREDRLALYKRDGFSCVYCGSTLNLQLDHLHPRSKGGSNHKSNLVTACRSCNKAKSNRIIPGRNREQKIRNYRKERLQGRTERQRYKNASRKKMKNRQRYYQNQTTPATERTRLSAFKWFIFWFILLLIFLYFYK